jgi:hypothetical protein
VARWSIAANDGWKLDKKDLAGIRHSCSPCNHFYTRQVYRDLLESAES